jgi:hypothetical protein
MSMSAMTSRKNRGIVGNSVFCWVSVEAVYGELKHKPVSQERVSRQTDQSESKAVVRQSLLVEGWKVGEPSLL